MKRGEIWRARIPMRGSGGSHPMLVVSNNAFNLNQRYPKVMVVHITSVKRLQGPYDWEVAVPRGTAGLTRSSIVKCSEIYTIWKEQLQGPAGTLPRTFMDQVDAALVVALSLKTGANGL